MADLQKYVVQASVLNTTWYIPLSYHVLTSVDYSLINNSVMATFASYFSEEAKKNGASPLDYMSVTFEGAENDYEALLKKLVVTGEHRLHGGKVLIADEVEEEEEQLEDTE